MSTKYSVIGKISFLTVLALLPMIAQAHVASDGLYAGANVGWSKFNDNYFTSGHSQDALGVSGFVGYQFSPWFSLESGVTSLGSAKGNDGLTMDVQGINLSSKFTYPLSGVGLYSRLGGMWYRSDVSKDDINRDYVGTGVAPLAALGIEYTWNSNMTSRIEYQWTGHLKNETATSATLNDGYLSVGMTWHFSQPEELLAPHAINHSVEKTTPRVEDIAPLNSELAIYYPFNQYNLSTENQQKIIDFYNKIKPSAVTKFNVDGYSDMIGSNKNNFIVSGRRAENVQHFLLDLGISRENISMHANGSTSKFNIRMPDKKNYSRKDSDYSLNRRVAIKAY